MAGTPKADADAVGIDELFGQGMAGPQRPREVQSPDTVDRDAPHGRDADGNVLAPYGWTKPQRPGELPRPKLSPGGRKAKDENARVASVTAIIPPGGKAEPEGQGEQLEQRDYTGTLADTAETIWVGLSMAAMLPLERIPVIGTLPLGKGRTVGQYLAGVNDRLAAEAQIFNHNRGALVAALNTAANHSVRARRLVDKLEVTEPGWVLICGAMVMPFVSQTASLWTGTLAADGLPSAAELAKANRETMNSWIERFNEQLAAAAAQAASAEQLGEQPQ